MTSQKGVIISTIVAALITAGVSLYVYFDGKKDGFATSESVNQDKLNSEEDEKVTPSPRISFTEVFVTPINTQVPSSFFAELTNSGNEAAIDFNVSVDFGEATPEKCELVSGNGVSESNSDPSVIKSWKVSELAVKQSLYVVCSLNAPFFKTISVNGGNLENDVQLTFSSYKKQKEEKPITFFEGLLRVVISVLSAILLFYFFLRLMRTLG